MRPSGYIISDADSTIFYWGTGYNLEGGIDEVLHHVDLDGSVIHTFYLPIAVDTTESRTSQRRDGDYLYLTTMQGISEDLFARWFVIDKLNIHRGVIDISTIFSIFFQYL